MMIYEIKRLELHDVLQHLIQIQQSGAFSPLTQGVCVVHVFMHLEKNLFHLRASTTIM